MCKVQANSSTSTLTLPCPALHDPILPDLPYATRLRSSLPYPNNPTPSYLTLSYYILPNCTKLYPSIANLTKPYLTPPSTQPYPATLPNPTLQPYPNLPYFSPHCTAMSTTTLHSPHHTLPRPTSPHATLPRYNTLTHDGLIDQSVDLSI